MGSLAFTQLDCYYTLVSVIVVSRINPNMDGDALAAIGLAANILQFIDWVSHVCDVGSQIRRNGMSDFNLDLDRTSAELKHQLQRIRPPPGTITCATRAEQVNRTSSPYCWIL